MEQKTSVMMAARREIGHASMKKTTTNVPVRIALTVFSIFSGIS